MSEKESELRGLFPWVDKDFELPDGKTLRVQVFSLGVVQIKRFSQEITGAIRTILPTLKVTVDDEKSTQDQAASVIAQVAPRLVPLILGDLCNLVDGCLKFQVRPAADGQFKPIVGTLDDLPHEIGVAVVQAWIKESFEDPKKWIPWMELWGYLKGMLLKEKEPTSAT